MGAMLWMWTTPSPASGMLVATGKNTVGTELVVIAEDGANLGDFVSCKVE